MNAAISAKNVTRTPLSPNQKYIGIRLQGTEEDLKWFLRMLEEKNDIEIISHSELYQNKGTSRFFREYVDVIRKKSESAGKRGKKNGKNNSNRK